MKIFLKLAISFTFIFGSLSGLCQTKPVEKCYIISFNTIYSSNLINMNSVPVGELYLIVSRNPIWFDSAMIALSIKKFSSSLEIRDSLRQNFKVYEIIEENSRNISNSNIHIELTNLNNYTKAYFYSVDSMRNTGPQIGYIILQYSKDLNIEYKTFSEKCGQLFDECALITSLK